MSEIHPAPGQQIAEIYVELEKLGFRPDREFWVHYTHDLKPFVQTTSEAYEAWEKTQLKDAEAPEPEAGSDAEPAEPDDAEDNDTDAPQTPAKKTQRPANRRR